MNDPCCVLCKGAHEICLSRHSCRHHKEADAQDEANHQARQTIRDPTARKAVANVMREKRSKRK